MTIFANQDAAPSARKRLLPAAGISTAAGLAGLTLCATIAPWAAAAPAIGARTALDAPSHKPLLHRVAVFGRDTRTRVPKSMQSTAAKLGILHDRRSQSVCTAFCVGPDTVATAAHCLYGNREDDPVQLDELTVRLHGSKTEARIAGGRQGVAAANVLTGSTRLSLHPPIEATRDWALVRLEKPLCTAGSFKLSRRTVEDVMREARAGRIYNIAYHRDLPKLRPMLARPCRVKRSFKNAAWSTIGRDFADPEQLLLHTCDTGAGSSGSPLLIDGPNGPEVVGISVGIYMQSRVTVHKNTITHRSKSDTIANTGANTLAFAAAFDVFRSSTLLTTRDEIRRLQGVLAAKALYTGPHDGRFTPALRTAITAYERAAHLPVTGLATHTLLRTLTTKNEVVTGKLPKEAPSSER